MIVTSNQTFCSVLLDLNCGGFNRYSATEVLIMCWLLCKRASEQNVSREDITLLYFYFI